MTQPKRAFVFDMDGTIVDNMAYHTKSWLAFFERRGQNLDADEFFRATAGRQGKEIMRAHLGEHLTDRREALAAREALALAPPQTLHPQAERDIV